MHSFIHPLSTTNIFLFPFSFISFHFWKAAQTVKCHQLYSNSWRHKDESAMLIFLLSQKKPSGRCTFFPWQYCGELQEGREAESVPAGSTSLTWLSCYDWRGGPGVEDGLNKSSDLLKLGFKVWWHTVICIYILFTTKIWTSICSFRTSHPHFILFFFHKKGPCHLVLSPHLVYVVICGGFCRGNKPKNSPSHQACGSAESGCHSSSAYSEKDMSRWRRNKCESPFDEQHHNQRRRVEKFSPLHKHTKTKSQALPLQALTWVFVAASASPVPLGCVICRKKPR